MALSTFLGLETALRGILAQQRAIDVTGHNIANASTAGYSRQTAELETTPAFDDVNGGQLGTGVDVAQYQRIRDTYVDVQLRTQTGLKGKAEAQQDGLQQVELSLNEPSDNGLSSLLAKYWSAWQDVSNAPEDMATRQALVESAKSLTGGINTLASQLSTIVTQTQAQQADTLTQVNSIGVSIAQLNSSIQQAELAGQQPNDLLDRRDLLLDQLNELGDVAVTQGTLGTISVAFGGQTLVDPTGAQTVASPPATFTTGKLAGMGAVVATANGYLGQLDTLASNLATATNAQHVLGYELNGTPAAGPPAQQFFATPTPGSEAATISVDPALAADPSLIAASGNGQPGDATNALAIADLQQKPLIGAATVDTYYSQLVTQVGSDSQQAQQTLANSTALVDALQNRRQSVSGVSLDEEMAALVRYQRGFQASARALSAIDDTLDQLINRTGRVGL